MNPRLGEIRVMNNGLEAKIVRYENSRYIDVEFLKYGAVVRNREYRQFCIGRIKCPMIFTRRNGYIEVLNPNPKTDLIFTIDECDRHILGDYLWSVKIDPGHETGYIMRSEKGRRGTVYLHREIMQAGEHDIVDHIDHNTQNNRRNNLRLCTLNENMWNKVPASINKTGYKGVKKDEWGGYRASIQANHKRLPLGKFDTAEEAALAYNEAALKMHGEFAHLNNIPPKDESA